jgi:bifunctional non-homologous end joining protein LigD
LPLIERKALLAPLIARLSKGGAVRYSDHVAGQGPAFFGQACKHHCEGILSDRAAAPYRSRRTEDWLKVKCLNRQEFVIGGWMASDTWPRATVTAAWLLQWRQADLRRQGGHRLRARRRRGARRVSA